MDKKKDISRRLFLKGVGASVVSASAVYSVTSKLSVSNDMVLKLEKLPKNKRKKIEKIVVDFFEQGNRVADRKAVENIKFKIAKIIETSDTKKR